MKKLIQSLAIILTLYSCSTPEVENNQTTTENILSIPQRFVGKWKRIAPNENVKAEVKINQLIVENLTRTNGTVIDDNGSTLFKADLGNNETLTLLLATYNQNTTNDDVLGITITNSNTPNVYVTNGYWVRD